MNRPILPPDPNGDNGDNAEHAEEAINRYVNATGTAHSDALADMLSNFMHWCDRNNTSFDRELRRARIYYADATDQLGTAGEPPST